MIATIVNEVVTTIDSVITELGDYGNPCAEWTNGELRGRTEHAEWPVGRIGRSVEVECRICGKHLYTERMYPGGK